MFLHSCHKNCQEIKGEKNNNKQIYIGYFFLLFIEQQY